MGALVCPIPPQTVPIIHNQVCASLRGATFRKGIYLLPASGIHIGDRIWIPHASRTGWETLVCPMPVGAIPPQHNEVTIVCAIKGIDTLANRSITVSNGRWPVHSRRAGRQTHICPMPVGAIPPEHNEMLVVRHYKAVNSPVSSSVKVCNG